MTQLETVLQMLQDAGEAGCLTGDFLRAGIPRASARCDDLRKLGYNIPDAVRVRKGSWRFVLLSERSDGEVGGVPRPAEGRSESRFNPDRSERSNATSLFEVEPQSNTRSAVSGERL